MKQLGILDAAFVNLEQSNTPQHVGGMGIYDPSTAPGGRVRFKDVIATFERRLDSHPLFRTRLVEVPGGLDRPYWIKDANFDVEFHLRHIALPEPGDWRQLCIQVARLHARPLDMSRPLWEGYIIEGLDNIPNIPPGSFAVYTKMHHALVDGAGGSSFMALLHDVTANPPETDEPSSEPRLVDTPPSTGELLTRASINGVRNTFGFARGTARTVRDMSRYLLDVARDEIPAPDVSAPRTILNQAVGPHRVFDAAEFPLAGFKAIKSAAGCTLNDVALGVISGALRAYLDARGELPSEGSLAAGLPLNMRSRRAVTDDNNQVGSVYASLHTDEPDPARRLALIRQSTRDARQSGESSPMVDVLKVAGAVSPLIARTAAGIWSRNALSQHLPLNISTVVSNVSGPDFPLFCAGARMVDYYGLGVLTPGVGLFHLVFSYAGKVTLSMLGDRGIMPDPQFYHDCLVKSYQETYESVLAESVGDAARIAREARAQAPRRVRGHTSKGGKGPGGGRRGATGKAGPASKVAGKRKAVGGTATSGKRKSSAGRRATGNSASRRGAQPPV